MQILNIKSYSKFSIITVLNWNQYQQNEHQMNIRRTSSEHKQEEVVYYGEFFSVTEQQHKQYLKAYPGLDPHCEYKKMTAWLESNPNKRKTKRGYPRFINNWLNKEYTRLKDKGLLKEDWRSKLKPY
jgi:hypothetical protein